jgi:molybdopterin adenylyltransferase
MRVAILTVSDRSARGEREDRSGPVLRSMASRLGWEIVDERVVPDEADQVRDALVAWSDGAKADVVLTTGGTGFGPRDRTPEATMEVCDRMAPGLTEAMRAASLQTTPHAMLSRAVAGIRGRTLIVNLPGSPRAAKENLEVIVPALPHAIAVLTDRDGAEEGHSPPGKDRHL